MGVILRLGGEGISLLPCQAAIGTAVDAARSVGGFHDGVERVGIGRRNGKTDAAEITGRETSGDLLPAFAAVCAPVDGRARPAVDDGPDVPAALITGRHK